MQEKFISILGPCSAENVEQVMQTADGIAKNNLKVTYFRAGIWKPRTRPGSFEGVGEKAFPWLQEVKEKYNWQTIVEVASKEQVEKALKAEMDALWIGARTSANPFSMQEIADVLKGVDIPVWIKNPINPDLELWIGAMERIAVASKGPIGLIHRGFSAFRPQTFRNPPTWEIPIEMKQRYPDLPMLLDPSHIAGERSLIPQLLQIGVDLGYKGWMVEVHPNPQNAWSDAKQQLKPEDFATVLENIEWKFKDTEVLEEDEALKKLRASLLDMDKQLLDLLAQRMQISQDIGKFKKNHQITILQTERAKETLKKWLSWASENGFSENFIKKLYEVIHLESIGKQGRKLYE